MAFNKDDFQYQNYLLLEALENSLAHVGPNLQYLKKKNSIK